NEAASVFGFTYRLKDPGMMMVAAEVRKDQSLDTARDELLKAMEEVVTRPPTHDEVERARQTLLKNLELNLKNTEFIGLTISDWAAQGDWRLLFLYRDRLRHISADDVLRVAKAYLKPSNRTLGLYIPVDQLPERVEVPRAPNITEVLKDYKGDSVLSAGEAFDPSPANIEMRVRRHELPSGLKMALLSKKTRGDSVVATFTFRYGDETSLKGHAAEATLAAAMLMRGTQKHTRQELKDELDRLKARMNVFGGVAQV